jgi:hypothetical protein
MNDRISNNYGRLFFICYIERDVSFFLSDSAEKIFLRKLRHQIEHLVGNRLVVSSMNKNLDLAIVRILNVIFSLSHQPEPKVRRKKSKLVSASIDSASVDSFKHTEQQTPLSPQVSSLKPTSSQQSPKSVSPRDTTTTQAIASLETLARAIDLTNSEHEDPHSSNGSSQHRHFGKPLTESLQVAESENVPHIVKMSCLYLREKALSAVGIFRVGRNRTELMELRRQIDEGKRIIFNEMDISVYDVADLLKMYLRELPEPPIPQTLYSEFLNVSRCPKEEQTTEIVIKKLIELLRKIPPESQDLLFDVVGLLHAIAVNSDANKMNAKNLAVVIVPCIVRSTETNDIKKMLEELSYAEMSFTYLITYFKDVFSFVVERQLQTSHNTLSKPQITVSAPKSATVTNEHETKQISASNTTESSASSTQKKNEKTTGFGKQILELEKEITDLESELLVNKEDTTALSTPDTSHSVATVVATTITNQSDSLSSTSSSSQDIRLVSPLLTTPVSDESTKISKEKSRKKKASIPQIVVNNTTQLSGTVSTSPKEKKEKSSQARAESTTEGNVLLPSPKDGDKQKKNKTDTRRSPRMRKATVSTLSPSLEVTNTKATDTNRLSKSEKRPRKNSSPSKKSLSGEFLLSKNSKASPQTEPSAVEHNETSLQTSNTSNSNTTTKDFGVITSSENSTKKHILTVEQPKTIILIVEQWSCERNDTSEVVECYLSNWSIKLTRQQSLTRLIQKVIAHAQTISNLLKSPDFDPGSLKDNIYAVVSYSREFSRFLKNEQHRKLIAKGIRTLLEKAIQMLQNLSSNNSKNSVLILTATTDLLRALTFAINNSK